MSATETKSPESDSLEFSGRSPDATLDQLNVNPEQGLSESEVQQRREKYGKNRLAEKKQRSAWQILIAQFKSPIIGLLAVAAVLSFAFQQWVEGVAVIIAILLNAGIGFTTELKALSSMQALQELSQTQATVRREGKIQEIPAEELVPGDIVILDSGAVIAADLRVLEASKMQVDESALTGESLPVTKNTEIIEDDVPLAERTNMLFKGTALTRGSGEGIVVATGMNTELGHISKLTSEAEDEITPLEKRLDKLGRTLIWVTLVIAVLVAIAGIIGGKDLFLMIETAIALAVAAVPEGLPIVATVALARGMWRMAKRNALINRLSAVETLGATNIICTDKTGTLTENRMTVSRIARLNDEIALTGEGLDLEGEFKREDSTFDPNEDERLKTALEVGVLCNNASLPDEGEEDEAIGDPMELALLVAGAKAGIRHEPLLEQFPEQREVAFDTDTKMMATYHESDNGIRVAVKGAPEAVFEVCSHYLGTDGKQEMGDSEPWQERSTQLAEEGLRILALAQKTVDNPDTEPYKNLTLVGIVGLLDPPREDVKPAIQNCHDAGIRVIMVTGDQPVTARNIGLAVGLTNDQEARACKGSDLKPLEELSSQEQQNLQQVPIFARVSPEQKLNLIALHQANNAIVAMTGDGVNDAPALKKADIGVAMGQRGTQVAREAADMVLQDDAFSSIVAAVRQGRAIFNNIRKFTIYLLSGNMGQIIAVGVASLINAPLPLLPLQILFLNVINDVFPALALGVGEGNPQQMQHPPRDKREAILTRSHWTAIGVYGVVIAAVVLGSFFLCFRVLGYDQSRAVTVSFLTLAFSRLWHVFNMRDDDTPIFRNEVTTNPYIWGALLLCTVLLLLAVYIPGLAGVLGVVHPGWQGWGIVLGISFVPVIFGQIWKAFR
ncbi:MAG: cation-translocating P-type ATPase [Spirulinaceae cyanobacterium]